MSRIKLALLISGGVVGVVIAGAVGFYAWASMTRSARIAGPYETHVVDFPIPPPLSEAELWALRAERAAAGADPTEDPLAGLDLGAIARERSLARGQHLLQARIACLACHGDDGSGGTMVDDPAFGTLKGPNLTSGKGSVVATYTASDWDRAVRHGVKPDGTASLMPVLSFLSDQELADIVFTIQSMPPVDNDVPPPRIGPILNILVATDGYLLGAEHTDPEAPHVVAPPDTADTLAFGRHVAQECAGCHRSNFTGGPVPGGPPDWPPAGDLTRADGFQAWTLDQFKDALRKGVRPDGTALGGPMAEMPKFAIHMSEQEISALYAYLQTF